MNNNENQNLNSVVPPTTVSGTTPVPQVPPENGVPTATPVAPAMPQAPEVPQPVPAAPVEPVSPTPINLQPEGTVPPVVDTPAPTVAEPLMGTPLNAQTVLNSGNSVPPVEPMGPTQPGIGSVPPMGPAQPGMGPVPPMPNSGMMGGIPTPPMMPTNGEEKTKKKMNPLIIVLVIVLVAAVGFGVYYFINQSKPKTPQATVKITPLFDRIELGDDIDTTLASSFVTVSDPVDVNSCEVSTDLNTKVVNTYQYTITCGQYKLEKQLITVSDTRPPVVKLKPIAVLPNSEVEANDFIDYIDDASTAEPKFLEDNIDTSTEGTYDIPLIVADEYGNQTEVTGKLVVSEDAPEYYLNCYETHLTSDKYKDAIVSNTYRFGINSLGESYNVYRTRSYRFETVESFESAAKDAEEEDNFDKYTGNIRINKENSSISISSEVDGDELKKEYELDEFPTYDMDIETFFTDKGFTCEQE